MACRVTYSVLLLEVNTTTTRNNATHAPKTLHRITSALCDPNGSHFAIRASPAQKTKTASHPSQLRGPMPYPTVFRPNHRFIGNSSKGKSALEVREW
jgi:hypothetical protein